MNYLTYFGFKTDPFSNDIYYKNLLELSGMVGIKKRMDYAVKIGGIMLLTGDVGTGKTSAIRWATSYYHPSQYLILYVTATGGSGIDLYRQLCWILKIDFKGGSRVLAIKYFKATLKEITLTQKKKVIIIIDEAGLLRNEIFTELHILTQFEQDSKNLLTLVLTGQANLMDKIMYRSVSPLASRVIAKSHLVGISREEMNQYIIHHLNITGVKNQIFTEEAITAIHQGSGGLLRTANHLARGGLIAAVESKEDQVTVEHIRLASTEII